MRLFMRRSSREWHDLLPLLAQALDTQRHDVAGLEIDRRRLHSESHAGGRAGRDDVPGKERHVLAYMRDALGNAENHGARVAVLHALAIHVQPHVERLRVAHFIGLHEPRPDGPGSVEALALVPLAGRHLERALGNVVHDAIAGDVIERIGFRDIFGLAPDHHAELHFPVELGRILRLDDVVARTVDAGGRLHEDDRLRRDGEPGFLGMVGVVQADSDEFADPYVRHAQARAAIHERQRFRLDLGQHLQAAWRDFLRPDAVDDLRKVAYPTVLVDETGLLVARLAVTAQLHIVIPPSIE